MSAQTIVVDPITRIEGHLRIQAQMNGDAIAGASSSGMMVRGVEIILRDRDPRDAWAFAQRFCGVCNPVQGIASVRTVEHALKDRRMQRLGKLANEPISIIGHNPRRPTFEPRQDDP